MLTSWIDSCVDKKFCNHFQSPVLTNGAAERICNKSTNTAKGSITVPLTPGALYRVKINSTDTKTPFQKVFKVSGGECKYQASMHSYKKRKKVENNQTSRSNLTNRK